jgi:hypothetical protein
MDAYDIFQHIRNLWVLNSDKKSGMLVKSCKSMPVLTWTPEGYQQVINARYDENLKAIILITDEK